MTTPGDHSDEVGDPRSLRLQVHLVDRIPDDPLTWGWEKSGLLSDCIHLVDHVENSVLKSVLIHLRFKPRAHNGSRLAINDLGRAEQ
jgi:hypothetical protein